MAAQSSAPFTALTKSPAVPEVDVLWMTAGLSCDGDSVSVTGATHHFRRRNLLSTAGKNGRRFQPS